MGGEKKKGGGGGGGVEGTGNTHLIIVVARDDPPKIYNLSYLFLSFFIQFGDTFYVCNAQLQKLKILSHF